MEDECIIVEEKDVHSGPPLKKLKQGRLPFTLLNSKAPQTSCLPPAQQKKRKHSGNEVTNKSLKNARQENNRASKQDTAKEELGYHKATEDEVSSSCDENIPDAPKDGAVQVNNKKKPPTLLQKFIKYERTRQDEVSTSVVDEVEEEAEVFKETKVRESEKEVVESNEVDSMTISEEIKEATPCRGETKVSPEKGEVCTSQSETTGKDSPSNSQTKGGGGPMSESISEDQSPKNKREVMEGLKAESSVQREDSFSQSEGTSSVKHAKLSPTSKDRVDGNQDSSPICATPTSSGSPRVMIVKKLTPKQQMREADKQKKREEKEELRKKKEEEKLEEKKKKEAERNEKERIKKEKEDEKIRQKEEKQKKKQEEQELKVKEKQKKEEEKRIAEEEEKKKKNRLSEKFTSFFVKKQDASPVDEIKTQGPFMQFRVKENMRIAPLVRTNLSEERYEILDHVLEGTHEKNGTYLDLLRTKLHTPKAFPRTWPFEEKREDDDYCEVIDEEDMEEEEEDMIIASERSENKPASKMKAKLLQFCENQRPAYWGTWTKKTTKINAKKPFNKDEELFDYEYDSDDDWEEEEAGESLSDSEGEDKEEEEVDNQYEVDNDFFVPHGYLSDDEGKDEASEDEEEKSKDKDLNKEKERLKVKQAEFEEEMKKKTKQKKPRVFGCLWIEDKVNPAYEQLMKILNPYRVGMCAGHSVPVGTSFGGDLSKDLKESKAEDIVDDKQTTLKKFVKKFPEEAIKPLIQLIHGNRHGKQFLIREFGTYWKKVIGESDSNETSPTEAAITPKTPRTFGGSAGYISKKKIEMKIVELGEWTRCPEGHGKGMMWFVAPEVRARYSAEDVVLPNTWDYNLKPKEHRETQLEASSTLETPEVAKPSANLITRFTKVLTEEEIKKNMAVAQGPANLQASPQQTSEKLKSDSPSSLQNDSTLEESPSSSSNTPVIKKKIALTPVPRVRDNHPVQTASIKNFFKKDTGQTRNKSPKGLHRTSPISAKVSTKDDIDIECITLE